MLEQKQLDRADPDDAGAIAVSTDPRQSPMHHNNQPVPLKSEEIPADLICAICMGLCVEPVITPCEHLFCRHCLQQAMYRQQVCPVDRLALQGDKVNHLREGSLLHRIWGGIKVKCANHVSGCAWTGQIVDYKAHTETCTHARGQGLQRKIEKLQKENQQLRAQKERQEEEIETLRADLARVEMERDARVDQNRFNEVKEGIRQLSEQLKTLLEENDKLRRRPNVKPLFTGKYNFGRENVVKLSCLIARYLEDKPNNIDTDRIFQCVESCYRDLQQGWNDNPPHYFVDVRMLLATALASTWFTTRQNQRMKMWMEEQYT